MAIFHGSERERVIVRTSVVGIWANIFLAAFKAIVGISAHSIAIVLDAVNNLSDALSSIITITGAKLAGRAPDKGHPLGHGRYEYVGAFLIGIIILYAGIASAQESVKAILHPATPDYTPVGLLIVATALLVKIFLGLYVQKKGRETGSVSLTASGKDALMDAVVSAAVLIAAFLYLWKGISVEPWLAAAISVLIMKAGVDTLRETVERILGRRADSKLTKAIKQTISSFPGVYGAYDLILHDYGPSHTLAAVHIEVPDTWTAAEIDKVTREIQDRVWREHHVIMTAVGIYSRNTSDQAQAIRDEIRDVVMGHEGVIQVHGFYVDTEEKTIRFDVIIDFDAPDRQGLYEHLCGELRRKYPDYQLFITNDLDVTD